MSVHGPGRIGDRSSDDRDTRRSVPVNAGDFLGAVTKAVGSEAAAVVAAAFQHPSRQPVPTDRQPPPGRRPGGHRPGTNAHRGLDPQHSVVDQMKLLRAPKTDHETRKKLARKWGCPQAIMQKNDHSAAMNRWLHKYIKDHASQSGNPAFWDTASTDVTNGGHPSPAKTGEEDLPRLA
jgi:hypothetical protein